MTPKEPTSWNDPADLLHIEKMLGKATQRIVVGPKPWAERPLAKLLMKAGLTLTVAGMTAGSAGFIQQGLLAAGASAGMALSQSADAHLSVVTPESAVAMNHLLASGKDASWRPWLPGPLDDLEASLRPQAAPAAPVLSALDRLLADAPPAEDLPKALLEAQEPFLALAATLEDFRDRPYTDPGGLNVGYGYCITKRIDDYGIDRVKGDLIQAGFSETTVDTLLSESKTAATRAAQKAVEVSPQQALALLQIARFDYEDIVRKTLGTEVFEGLAKHRQATLTWLAYNTGHEGFPQFKKLAAAVQNDRPLDAVRHMTPHYTDNNVVVANARAGTILMSAYWSDTGMDSAVLHTSKLLSAAQSGTSPILAGDKATVLPKRTAAPTSPYTLAKPAEPVVPQASVEETQPTPLIDTWHSKREARAAKLTSKSELRSEPDNQPTLTSARPRLAGMQR